MTMSISMISMARVECDSCGALRDEPEADHIVARVAAAKDGWRYVKFNIRGRGLQKRVPKGEGELGSWTLQAVPRSWDCCPDCPLPDTPVEAAEIRSQRKVQDSKGKWVARGEDA